MTPYYDADGVTLYHGDCRDILPALGEVDHVLTDPPYSEHVSANSMRGVGHRAGGKRQGLGFEALTGELREAVGAWMAVNCRRWALVFSDVESTMVWRETLIDQVPGRLEYVRTGAWVKLHATPQFTGDRPGTGFEAVTICHQKGKKRWNGGGELAVWSYPTAYRAGDAVVHTTQKPEGLMLALVQQFTDPGETICDMFAGSGTTLAAAKRLGRKAIGIEQDETYCEAIAKRLAQRVLAFEESA